MLQLVICKNALQPEAGRIITEWKYANIRELRKQFPYPVSIEVDGWKAGDDYIPSPLKDFRITVKPVISGGGGGSSKVFGIIAMVALTAYGMGAVGGAFATTAGVWTSASYFAAGALLLGSVLQFRGSTAKIDAGSYNQEYNNDPTYSWNGVETMEGQNNPITVTYGKVKSGGQTIGKRVDYYDNKETLNWLISAGEGVLDITDVKLNDTPIGNYTGATLQLRQGTNNQSMIEFFDDTTSTKSLAYEVMEDYYRTEELDGNGTEQIVISMECTQGLYYANDDGGLDTATVSFRAQYKLHDSTEWVTFAETSISGAQQTAIRRQYKTGRLPPGQYDVRVIVTGRSHARTSNRSCTRLWWSMVSTVVFDDFVYPNIALIAIKAVATDQLSGSPTLSFIKERKNVWVFNPEIGEYEEKPANNPAWACYDLLHLCRKLEDADTGEYVYDIRGVKTDAILYENFKEWAAWCEEKNLKVNIEITSTAEMLDVINNQVANIGRGKVIRFGTRYGAIWDRVQEPVQMFGMGNILKDTFKEEFVALADRANCVEITYNDAEREYERQTIMVFGTDYNNDPNEKPAQLTLNGCTSYKQAFREGKYQMFCNERILRTCSFEADIDSIACTVGDVITISHDVPQWAYSGRIQDVDANILTLPCVVEDLTKTYDLYFRSVNDNRYKVPVTILEVTDEHTKVRLNDVAAENPAKHDIFDIAMVEKGQKPFKIIAITRASDFTRTITCIEYDEAVYNENYEIPPIQYSMGHLDITDVTEVTAKQVAFTNKGGQKQSKMFVSWKPAESGGKYNVSYSEDGKNYKILGITSDTTISGIVEPFTTYYVKVVTIKNLLQSNGVIIHPVPPGIDAQPPNVKELNVETLRDGTRRWYWDFEYPDPNDIDGFEIRVSQNEFPNWNNALKVQDGLVTSQPYEATTIRQGAHAVMIKAIDNAGNESPLPAVCIVDFGDILEENVLFKLDHSENGWEGVLGGYVHWQKDGNKSYWSKPDKAFWQSIKNCYVDENGWLRPKDISAYWTTPERGHWTQAGAPHWKTKYLPIQVDFSFKALAGGYWWVNYEITGGATIWYKINNDGIWKQYSTKIRVHAGDKINLRITSNGENIAVKKIVSIIDVPDREEHFDNLTITTSGITLPIRTPNYYTTAVRIDSVPLKNNTALYPIIINRNPCQIALINQEGTYQEAEAVGITWQGFEKEELTNE